MCPSNGTEATGLEFFDTTTFDDCFPLSTCVDLTPTESPSSMLLFPDDVLDTIATSCHNNDNARQPEGGLPTPLSQRGAGEERAGLGANIPLTVLELEVDGPANTSPERTFLPVDYVLVTPRSVPGSRKRVSGGGVRQRSLDSSDGPPRGTKARKFSEHSTLESSLIFRGIGNTEAASGRSFTGQINDLVTTNRDSGRRQLELRDERKATPLDMLCCRENSGNQMATEPITEMSSVVTSSLVPHLKLDRRREQNRRAANRCRHKRKQEEDQLMKDFESTEKDNRLRQEEIQNLLCQIEILETELLRHASTDHCYVIHGS